MPAGAIAVGPLIGGFATTYLSWRWVFAGESPTGPRCWGSPRWSGWCWAACSSPSRCTCRSSWAWQNTGTNLGASIGTALDGSILIAGLTASFLIGIQQNPAIPADVKAQASVDV
jgi:hypothetical protein